MEKYWERINKAIKMVYEYGHDAWPLEREAVDRNAEALVRAVPDNFAFIDPNIREYLEEIRFCGWQIIIEA